MENQRLLNRSELSYTSMGYIVEDQRLFFGAWGRATHVDQDSEPANTHFAFIPDNPAPGNPECKPVWFGLPKDTQVRIIPEENVLWEENQPKKVPFSLTVVATALLGGLLWAAFAYFGRELFGGDFTTVFK